MSNSNQQPHRERGGNYEFRTELSGLERPRQWLGLVLTVVGTFLAMALVAFIAFR